MPQVHGPAPGRGAVRDTDNCAYVRERLAATQPGTARAADAVVENADLAAGLYLLLRLMAPGRAARHPLLAVAA